jgi:asparagine synthase (glutamine-hydrolysing)
MLTAVQSVLRPLLYALARGIGRECGVGAIVGIIGAGDLEELGAMATRMAYRGRYLRTASPAPGVLLGELHQAPGELDAAECLCLDANGALYPRARGDARTAAEANAEDRRRLARELRERGGAALTDASGHFALAHWDGSARTVSLASDRQGFKTFYYVELPGRVAFASDYKALLALPDCPAEVDRDVLQTYLVLFSCPAGRSLLKGVKPLSQASILRIRDGRTSLEKFWTPLRRQATVTFDAAARLLRGTLESSFASLLAGHDRASLLLSGGFDSAALLALVRHVRPDLRLATYTIGHGPDDADILGARRVAAHFGSEHHEQFHALGDLPAELPRMVWLTEDLSGRDEAILQQAITAAAAKDGSLVLAGHGADAVFGGMPRHRILWLRDHAMPPLRGALCELYTYTRFKRMPASWLGRQLVKRAYHGDLPAPPRLIDAQPIGVDAGCKSLERYLEEHIAPSSGFLHDEPVLAEQAAPIAMPFLDPAVTESALGCPGRFHVSLREQKRLLRAAVAGLMPQAMLKSRKTIQRLRHDSALTDTLHRIAENLDLARSLADRRLIAGAYVQSLVHRNASGSMSPESLHSLWGLICAELWLRQFVDGRGQPDRASA